MKALIGVCLERMAKADKTPAGTVPLDSSSAASSRSGLVDIQTTRPCFKKEIKVIRLT